MNPHPMESSTNLSQPSLYRPTGTIRRNLSHYTTPAPARSSTGSSAYEDPPNPESCHPRPRATPSHLQPILQMLQRARSRSPTTRATLPSVAVSTTDLVRFSSVAPPVLHNLATSQENLIQQALDFLPHNQVRLHLQSILSRNSCAERDPSSQSGAGSAHFDPSNATRNAVMVVRI